MQKKIKNKNLLQWVQSSKKMSDLSRAQFSQIIDENRGKYAYKSDALIVAQFYDFVKTYQIGKTIVNCINNERAVL